MKTQKRLEQLLDEKDSRIEELEKQVQELTDESECDWKWARHKTLKKNPDNLPVPRLEMRWHQESDDGYLQRYDYALIYKHTLGHLVSVPLGQTKTQGGNGKPPIHNGKLQTPFRDGVHIVNDSAQLNLPAFCIIGDKIARVFLKDGVCDQEAFVPNKKLTQDAVSESGASLRAASGSVFRSHDGKEFRFNDLVCIEMLMGVPDEKRTGRLVQVRKGCGQFGSCVFLVRLRDGSLAAFENAMIRHASDKRFEDAFYRSNGKQPPVIPDQPENSADSETESYSIAGKWNETGFIVENPSQPQTPGAFSMMVYTPNDKIQP